MRRGSALALLLVSAAGALLLAEGLVRWLRPAAASKIVYPCFYEEDERFGYRYVPESEGRVAGHFEIDNVARINSLGFHDEEPLPAATWRILAVGDSFTAGLNLPRAQLWTAVLERELRARGHPGADVVNLGIDGTGTAVHRDVVESFLPRLHPQTVILAFYANDLLDVMHGRFRRECHRGYVLSYQDDMQRAVLRARVDAHLERSALAWLFEHSWLARLAIHAASGPRNPYRMNFVQTTLAELGIDEAVREERRARFPELARELVALAQRCECRFAIVPVPPRRDLRGSRVVLEQGLGRLPLEVVDVVPAIERMLAADGRGPLDMYWVHDNHLNAYGNELFGRAVAEALQTAGG